jgi:hypothetical protein
VKGVDGLDLGSDEERTPLRIGAIEIGDDGVSELTREGHRVVFVDRRSVERITVAHGFTGERPIAALLGTLLFFSCVPIALVLAMTALQRPQIGSYRLIVAVVFPTAMGVLCLRALIHRGWYLRVDTARDSRKLPLRGTTDQLVLREILRVAGARFGYAVQ